MTPPKFIQLIRHHIPKEGLETDRPFRVKSKLVRALNRANIPSETIRGIGRKIGPFLMKYEYENGRLSCSFERYDPAKLPVKKKRSKSRKSNPTFIGRHPSIIDMSLQEFVEETLRLIPEDWTKCEEDSHRWLSVDFTLMIGNNMTPQSAVEHMIQLSNQHLQGQVNYAVIEEEGTTLIGIGPV